MREHPIPQDIVGYKFHIVGSMTLKQFAELAVGAILGLIIYSTNLPAPIKWPLIFFAAALGAAAAFLPIEERPLDHWLTVFVQTLYKPTKFFWKKSSKIPDIFLFKAGQEALDTKDEVDLTPARRERIKEYLASVDSFARKEDKYDLEDESRLSEIMQTFNEVQTNTVKVTKKKAQKPQLKLKARSLKAKQAALNAEAQSKDQNYDNDRTHILRSDQVANEVSVPSIHSTKTQIKDETKEEVQTVTSATQKATYIDNAEIQAAAGDESKTVEKEATFNAFLPFPTKPTTPNKLVGMILTPNNELIPDSVVEIKDEQNRVVRAVKSNALGQFFINTPLKNGSYTIFVKHPKYHFNLQEVVLADRVIEPIEIRSLS